MTIREQVVNNNSNNKHFRERGDDLHKYHVNEEIRADSMLVINHVGENLGVLSKYKALSAAEEAGLDLVQVGEKDGQIIAKIMDFGKFLYMKKKQLADAKKHQVIIQIKEIKIRPQIEEQDYKTKLNHAEKFFKEGKKVKFTLQFKGREVTMMEDLGTKLFARITNDLAARDLGVLVEEKEGRSGSLWSKIYGLKEK
jgi:translation initiation factor IF-3